MATISVLYGSVRTNRQGIRAANFMVNQLKQRGHTVDLLDAKVLNLPLIDKMYKEYTEGDAPAVLASTAARLRGSDGFVVVSGEYNHSIPPALKNLLDYFQKEYFFKPSAIVTYSAGSFGGVRVAVHLRALLGELGMTTIPSMFPVPSVQNAFSMEGEANDDQFLKRADRFLGEFEWYLNALKSEREKGLPY